MKTALRKYADYLLRSQNRQIKDWDLIQEFSIEELKVRSEYLSGTSKVEPFYGTGISSLEDHPQIVDAQKKLTAIINQYYFKDTVKSADQYMRFFDELLRVREELL